MRISDCRGSRIQPSSTLIKIKNISLKPIKTSNFCNELGLLLTQIGGFDILMVESIANFILNSMRFDHD